MSPSRPDAPPLSALQADPGRARPGEVSDPGAAGPPRALAGPPGLVALTCSHCGARLRGHGGAALEEAGDPAVFLCGRCGRGWELRGQSLGEVPVRSVKATSQVSFPGEAVYLAVWRFPFWVRVTRKRTRSGLPPDALWRRLLGRTRDEEPHLFVPAFDLGRTLVEQLGVRLTERQPRIPLEPETVRTAAGSAPRRREPSGEEAEWGTRPFAGVSPVILGEQDARVVAHFVYLALESRITPDLRGIDYELRLGRGDLLLVPAEFNVRYVRDSNWRFLLREYDSLVV